MRRTLICTLTAGLLLAGTPSLAQPAAPTAGGLSALGGKGAGLLGNLLPNIGGASVGNAAGLLGYCVKNKLVGTTPAKGATGMTTAQSTLGTLLGRPDVAASPGLAAGQNGQLVTGNGNALSLDSMKGKVKTRVCDLVLQHAKSFL